MTLLSTAQHIARDTAQKSALAHDPDHGRGNHRRRAPSRWLPICCGRPGRRALPAIRSGCRSASEERSSTCRQRRSAGKSSATPGRRSGSISVSPFRRWKRPRRRSMSAPIRSRKGTADRPDLRVDISPSRHAGAGHAGPHHLSALPRTGLNAGRRRIDDARVSRRLALRQRRPVLRHDAEPQRALHARRPDARHVPERTPHRRGRSDVPLSTKLAFAVARRC